MRKVLLVCLLLITLLSVAICVQAADYSIYVTPESGFEVGETAIVDEEKTLGKILQDGDATAELHNAALEKNVQYAWVCTADGSEKQGKSVTWSEADLDKEYFCRIRFYSDSDCTALVETVDGQVYVIHKAPPMVDVSPAGPFTLTVGVPFQQQLTCNVEGVTYELALSKLPTGLSVSASGLISGTPTEAGIWYTTIGVMYGGDQIGGAGIDFTVQEAPGEPPKITTKSLPEAIVGQSYKAKVESDDPDAVFAIYHNPGKANDFEQTGLTLEESGEIQGKPAKAGEYTFCIQVSNDYGEDYRVYTLTVKDAQAEEEPSVDATEPDEEVEVPVPEETEPGTETPDSPTTEPVEEPEEDADPEKSDKENDSDKKADDSDDADEENSGVATWVIVLIVILVVLLGAAVAVIVYLIKFKMVELEKDE